MKANQSLAPPSEGQQPQNPDESRRGLARPFVQTAGVAAVAACLFDAAIASHAAGQTITEFTVPTANSSPRRIVAGPDGNLWFMELAANKIARITPAGVITEFAIPTASGILGSDRPAAGPDGNIWFGESNVSKIGKVTPAGVITEFSVPTSPPLNLRLGAGPGYVVFAENGTPNKVGKITPAGVISESMVPTAGSFIRSGAGGSDSNTWFSEEGVNQIGRVTPAGVITEFSVPTANSGNQGMAAGPDSNLWFVETTASQVGRSTTAGAITEFATPTPNSFPVLVVIGPDGNLWFFEAAVNAAVRIDTTGPTFTEIPVALNFANLADAADGPDGNFWFIDPVSNQIDRVTTAGVVTSFAIPTASSDSEDIAAGPDGNIWFVERTANKIGRITTGTFVDVPANYWAFAYIQKIVNAGVTAGCGGGNYCPEAPVTRAQMAVFLLRAEHGSSYTPPACTAPGIFGDVACPGGFAVDWIEQFYNEGITGGCSASPLLYCPDASVTRAQMAVFLLRAEHGSTYTPPVCHGVFADVPCPGGFAVNWIEQLSAEGITGGCGGGNYCPDNPNNRAQMAVFLVATFGL